MTDHDTRPNAYIEWQTFITEDHSRVFTPEQMEDLGYVWHANERLPDGGEWRHNDRSDIADMISEAEDDASGGFTELTREVAYPVHTKDAAPDE